MQVNNYLLRVKTYFIKDQDQERSRVLMRTGAVIIDVDVDLGGSVNLVVLEPEFGDNQLRSFVVIGYYSSFRLTLNETLRQVGIFSRRLSSNSVAKYVVLESTFEG